MMQTDGNLVLYYLVGQTRQPLWSTGTSYTLMKEAVMQYMGNLVLFDSQNRPGWSSNSEAGWGSFLKIEETGELIIYNSYHLPSWRTHTKALCPGNYFFGY
jgi:hypothetical protein